MPTPLPVLPLLLWEKGFSDACALLERTFALVLFVALCGWAPARVLGCPWLLPLGAPCGDRKIRLL